MAELDVIPLPSAPPTTTLHCTDGGRLSPCLPEAATWACLFRASTGQGEEQGTGQRAGTRELLGWAFFHGDSATDSGKTLRWVRPGKIGAGSSACLAVDNGRENSPSP